LIVKKFSGLRFDTITIEIRISFSLICGMMRMNEMGRISKILDFLSGFMVELKRNLRSQTSANTIQEL